MAVSAAALGALALAMFVWWHVSDLQAKTRANYDRMLGAAVSRVSRMLDAWLLDREAEGAGLAEIAGAHGTDSTTLNPAVAGRILHFQMDNLVKRRAYEAIWMVGASGHLHGQVGDEPMSAAEDSAGREAIRTGAVVFSRPEARDTVVTIGMATPIMTVEKGVRVPGAVVIMRTNLNRVLTVTGTPRVGNAASAVLVRRIGDSLIGVRMCGARATWLCVSADPLLGQRALRDTAFTGVATGTDGARVMFASHRMEAAPWAIYYASPEAAMYAPMRDTLKDEAWLMLAIICVAGLGMYAVDRNVNLRRLSERAQTEARFSTIVNTAMDAIIIVDRDYRISLMNVAADRMFHFGAGEAVGRSVLDMMPEASREAIRRALEQTLRSGEQPRLFTAGRHAAGRRADGVDLPDRYRRLAHLH